MNDLLKRQFEAALTQSRNVHASNISRDFLDIFVRVAKDEPSQIEQVIDILLDHINVHRSNTTASIYCLIKLADVSDNLKRIVKDKIGNDFVGFYTQDKNQDIANNAIILGEVLNGVSLSQFQHKKEATMDNPGSTTYNLNNSNLAINSPNATQSIKIDELDDDLKGKIAELQQAVDKKDKSAITKVFAYIADKSVDVAIALLTQGIKL